MYTGKKDPALVRPGFKRDLYEMRQYRTEILHTFIRVLQGLKVQNYFEKMYIISIIR